MSGASPSALRKALRIALDEIDRRSAEGAPIVEHVASLLVLGAQLAARQDLTAPGVDAANARAQLTAAVDALDDALGDADGLGSPSHGWYATGYADGLAYAATEIEAERARRGVPPSAPSSPRRLS